MTDRDGEDQAFVDAISEWPDINDGPPTLAGFLLARFAEEEALARESCSTLLIANLDLCAVPGSDHQATLRHHERWEPRRVLAECEAKRRIIDVAVEDLLPNTLFGEATDDYGWAILYALALPYADHPDYRDEWRP